MTSKYKVLDGLIDEIHIPIADLNKIPLITAVI